MKNEAKVPKERLAVLFEDSLYLAVYDDIFIYVAVEEAWKQL